MTNYAEFVPELWSTILNSNFDNTSVMDSCVNKKYEGEIKNAGDTVHIQTFGNVTVRDYGDSDITYEVPSGDSVALTLSQKSYFAINVPDIEAVQSNVDLIQGYTNRATAAIALKKDTYLLGKHSDVPAGNIVEATGYVLDKDTIYSKFVELAKVLKNNNAVDSTGRNMWCVINPEVEATLIQAPEFCHASETGDKTIREGAIAKIAGMDILVCTNLQAVANKIYVMAGITDAISYAGQVAKLEDIRFEKRFGTGIRGLYVYGALTVNPNQLAKLVVDVSSEDEGGNDGGDDDNGAENGGDDNGGVVA
ncbi:MAG: hypothetical protein MJ180_00600 [Candidatus Gastranaerophilales bacterium]|nr:hypothetical protein [Candidatus Gastranaerophilales bacterium]